MSTVAATAGDWSVEPLQLGPLVVVALAYARRARTLARRGRPISMARQSSFYGGVSMVLVAFVSPIDAIGEERLFWVHMSQHLLLGDLGPLAIVLGLNGPLLRPLLALPLVRRLRVLAHPFVALPLWTANLYIWHLSAVYEAALAHAALHALQHVCFFTAGAFMWAAVVEPLPGPTWFGSGWKAVYVLAVRTAGAVLANVLIWAGEPLYDRYAPGERASGVSPAADQTIGGAIMFVEGGVVTLMAFAWLFLRWTREAEVRQRLIERGEEPKRASRSARYGRSAAPRRRSRTGGPEPSP